MSLRPSVGPDVRKKAYKTGVESEDAGRRREGNLVEIRKSKPEDSLLKKRREALPHAAALDPAPGGTANLKLENLPGIVQGVWSENPGMQLEATTQFRKLLSIGMCAYPWVNLVIVLGSMVSIVLLLFINAVFM